MRWRYARGTLKWSPRYPTHTFVEIWYWRCWRLKTLGGGGGGPRLASQEIMHIYVIPPLENFIHLLKGLWKWNRDFLHVDSATSVRNADGFLPISQPRFETSNSPVQIYSVTSGPSEHPFTGPEPACGISIWVAKKAVRDWTNRNHRKHWESITGLK
jgi:hypothetical protein